MLSFTKSLDNDWFLCNQRFYIKSVGLNVFINNFVPLYKNEINQPISNVFDNNET